MKSSSSSCLEEGKERVSSIRYLVFQRWSDHLIDTVLALRAAAGFSAHAKIRHLNIPTRPCLHTVSVMELPGHHPACRSSLSMSLLTKAPSRAPRTQASSCRGLEININEYLLEEAIQLILGNWDICDFGKKGNTCSCVYPRLDLLIRRAYRNGAVELIVLIGPKTDLMEFENAFLRSTWSKDVPTDFGLSQNEALHLWRRLGSCG